ncbi:MAG: glutathione S-transferase family protein [Caulobacteraceae bacterium]
MTYTLYSAPGTAGMPVHWLLIELGEPFELISLDIDKGEQKSAAYLALNPGGHVPTLVIDGQPHTEIAALLMLVAERDPQRRFDVPTGAAERAAYLQWMLYLANTLQPAFRAWFYPQEMAGAENADAAKVHARERIERCFGRLDSQLADGRACMLGERMTAVDFLAAILARWSRNMPKPATEWPHLRAYIGRMRAMPSLRDVHRREGLTDWIGG